MRILGLDYGEARVGVAISDPFGWTAQGLESIAYHGNEKVLWSRLEEIIKEYVVEKIIVGFPVNMNGTQGPRIQKTEAFIQKLLRFRLPIEKIDERLTTVAAHRTMTDLEVKKEKKKGIVDTLSAVYILQIYLDKTQK